MASITTTARAPYHYAEELEWVIREDDEKETEFTYTFENFFHPFVGELIERLNTKSLAGLLDAKYHESLATSFFDDVYDPHPKANEVVFEPFPDKEIDVSDGGAYANYNWELLFHVPLTIAVHLSKNQRFAEAQHWFHYIFDPTCTDENYDPPQRFWKFLRFRQESAPQQIDEILALLSKPDDECTQDERDQKIRILEGYRGIMTHPFQPHRVARTRVIAYQYSVLMKYLDNLIAWGDSLFMQDTLESVNEATQRYVLAANLLGPRPQRIPPRGTVRPKTFAQLRQDGLDEMGNALVELEGAFPFNLATSGASNGTDGDQSGPLFGIGRTLYFCIPRNEKLLGYWDTVADRLYKIRHCMNIEGVVRMLALFEPPLDPGMLVKAAAAGIDVGDIVGGLNQPLGPVRAQMQIQQAQALCGEVRGLGNALLAAIEKQDGEHMALLRQGHELRLQEMARDVRFLQWKQAQEATEALLRGRASALERYRFYLRLLGLAPDENLAPDTLPLDRRELTEENFDDAYDALVGQYDKAIPAQPYPELALAGGDNPDGAGTGQLYLTTSEDSELNEHLPTARDTRLASSAADTLASVLVFIPDFNAELHFWGLGGSSKVFGGSTVSEASKIAAQILRTTAAWEQDQASMASRTATFQRRADDWLLQGNLAARELVQIGRQIIGSLIAEQVAYHDYRNVQTQIAQAQEVDSFLREKFTTEELYGWMNSELSRLYYEYYRFAVDTARKAERTMKWELMRPELDDTQYVKFNYWDGGRKGLLSGEALYLDIKRMEIAYQEHNSREFELTRHVSLRQLDPLALLTLKVTGSCELSVPESLFDRDCPGHYMRRLKHVALSIPSVVGPYTSLNCTLSLLRSSVRRSPALKDGAYRRASEEDDRFMDSFGSVESIVTSGGANDSGLFETNLRDERPLPFENMGTISTWKLSLPDTFRGFDYMTISDVVLHFRYTARQGGEQLAEQASTELREELAAANTSGLALLFSLRHDFPTAWAAFVNGDQDFGMTLHKDHFPYMVQGETLAVETLSLYAPDGDELATRSVALPGNMDDDLNGANGAAELRIPPDNDVLPRNPDGQVFLIVRYRLGD